MSRSIENSRRHGPFDPRFRARRSTHRDLRRPLVESREIAGWEDEGGALRRHRGSREL
jgi:hypothetical protein